MTENIHTIELTFYLKNMNLKDKRTSSSSSSSSADRCSVLDEVIEQWRFAKITTLAGGLMTTALVLTIQVDASAHPLS